MVTHPNFRSRRFQTYWTRAIRKNNVYKCCNSSQDSYFQIHFLLTCFSWAIIVFWNFSISEYFESWISTDAMFTTRILTSLSTINLSIKQLHVNKTLNLSIKHLIYQSNNLHHFPSNTQCRNLENNLHVKQALNLSILKTFCIIFHQILNLEILKTICMSIKHSIYQSWKQFASFSIKYSI